jgi:hypothetical protein
MSKNVKTLGALGLACLAAFLLGKGLGKLHGAANPESTTARPGQSRVSSDTRKIIDPKNSSANSSRPSAAVPKLVRPEQTEPSNTVQTDPTAADYDPVAVRRVLQTPARQIFEAEPRLPAWAGPMETTILEGATADVTAKVPAAKVTSVECRTATCAIQVSTPPDQADATFAALQTTVWGDRCNPRFGVDDVDGRVIHEMTCMIGPKNRDHDKFVQEIQRRREKTKSTSQ